MQRGLISAIDADTIEKTLKIILKEFPYDKTIYTTEVGTCDGDTSRGIHKFILENGRDNYHTGIDSSRDKVIVSPFAECNFIESDSIQAHTKVPDNSQHFLFIDANHTLFYTTADFLLYKNKVVVGGYLGFHDTSIYCKPFTDYQHIGSRENPHNYISCRESIDMLGLLSNRFPGWKLIFDEADSTNEAGGVTIFQRIY